MRKKGLCSIVLMSAVSLAFAQDMAKENKPTPVEKSHTLNNTVIELKPIRISDQNAALKGGERKKSVQPVAKPMEVKVARQLTPVKGNVNNNKK